MEDVKLIVKNITFKKDDTKLELELDVNKSYKVLVKNCVDVYKINGDKFEPVNDSNLQIRILVGNYVGYAGDDTHLAFDLVKDNTQLYIKVEDIQSIEPVDSLQIPVVKNNSETNPVDELRNSTQTDVASKIALLERQKMLKAKILNNNALMIAAEQVKQKETFNQLTEKEMLLNSELDIVETELSTLSKGGKRRTSKKGGASKKHVSKKDRNTRKAKRAGRKV